MSPELHGRHGWELVEFEYGETSRWYLYERTINGRTEIREVVLPHAPVRSNPFRARG